MAATQSNVESILPGPKYLDGWILDLVNTRHANLYQAVICQAELLGLSFFLKSIPDTTTRADWLKKESECSLGTSSLPTEASDVHEEVSRLVKVLNAHSVFEVLDVGIAVVDTRHPEAGFTLWFKNSAGDVVQTSDPVSFQQIPYVIRLAKTGNHFLSVLIHPALAKGALLEAFDGIENRKRDILDLPGYNYWNRVIDCGFSNFEYNIRDNTDGTVSIKIKPEMARHFFVKTTDRYGKTEKKNTTGYDLPEIFHTYGVFMDEQDFSLMENALRPHGPHSILTIDRRKKIKLLDTLLEDSRFASHMEKLIPKDLVSRVELGSSCLQTSPCKHDVTIYSKEDSTGLQQGGSLREFGRLYAEFLTSAWEFMHVYRYLEPETREALIADKIAPILNNPELDCIHIKRWSKAKNKDGIPTDRFYEFILKYKDGKRGILDIPSDQDIVRYFGIYLDDKSFNATELQKYITPELRAMRDERNARLKPWRDQKKADLLGLEALPEDTFYSEETNIASLTDLMRAASNNDRQWAMTCLASGEDINARSHLGSTPVMFAAEKGHLQMVEWLLGQGASLAAANRMGVDTFHYAVRSGSLPLVRWLLDVKGYQPASARALNIALFQACYRVTEVSLFLFRRFLHQVGSFQDIRNGGIFLFGKTSINKSQLRSIIRSLTQFAEIDVSTMGELIIHEGDPSDNEVMLREKQVNFENLHPVLARLCYRSYNYLHWDHEILGAFIKSSIHVEKLSMISEKGTSGINREDAEKRKIEVLLPAITELVSNPACQLRELTIDHRIPLMSEVSTDLFKALAKSRTLQQVTLTIKVEEGCRSWKMSAADQVFNQVSGIISVSSLDSYHTDKITPELFRLSMKLVPTRQLDTVDLPSSSSGSITSSTSNPHTFFSPPFSSAGQSSPENETEFSPEFETAPGDSQAAESTLG